MKREIKFRGKDSNNSGKWRYGSLLSYPDDNYVIVEFDGHEELSWDVGPDTVGQFTGLHDKSGREIYEGDILSECGTDKKVEVIYNAPEFCFKRNKHGYYFLNHPENFVVIGNIHDNPELKKGGEKWKRQ